MAESESLVLITQLYAQIAGVFAVFGITGMAVYIARSDRPDSGSAGVPVSRVVSALYYAMASLTICCFLYVHLLFAANASPPEWLPIALVAYGCVFGLSILSLFYAIALMMFEHRLTRPGGKTAYWIVVFLGPLVVVPFVLNTSHHVRALVCDECGPSPIVWGRFALAGVVLVAWGNGRWGWFDNLGFVRDMRRHLSMEANLPVALVCYLTIAVAAGSLMWLGASDVRATEAWINVILIATFLLYAIFAFACGNVIVRKVGVYAWGRIKRTQAQRPKGFEPIVEQWKSLTDDMRWKVGYLVRETGVERSRVIHLRRVVERCNNRRGRRPWPSPDDVEHARQTIADITEAMQSKPVHGEGQTATALS